MQKTKKARDKIFLENLIFYHASLLNKEIFFYRGRIIVDDGGVLLFLVQIYNYFFGAENESFLDEDLAEERKMAVAFWKEYLKDKKKNPTKVGFSLGVKNPRF